MAKKLSIEKAVEEFVTNVKKPFSLDEAVKRVRPLLQQTPKNLQKIVAEILEHSRWAFIDQDKDNYSSRAQYFHDAVFRITPMAAEIEHGILFPGHRFIPFCAQEVLPYACKLKLPDGTTIRRKKVKWKIMDAVIYHTLFGQENVINYFVLDSEANAAPLMEGDFNSEISLTAYNMKKVYEKYDFKPGDNFIVRVEDWKNGEYSLEYSPAQDLGKNFTDCRKWCELLEQSLGEAFDELGSLTDIYEQLAYAFFKGGKFLVETPGLSIGKFLEQTKKVEITGIGIHTILWRKGESPEDALPFGPEEFEFQMTGTTESLSAILEDIGGVVTAGEVEAYMRDECYQGSKNLSMPKCVALGTAA